MHEGGTAPDTGRERDETGLNGRNRSEAFRNDPAEIPGSYHVYGFVPMCSF